MRIPSEDMMIDRVDDDDVVIGPINRQNIFREQANFRSVHIFVVNSKGEILLQKIAAEKERYPGFWGSSAAGYIFSDESYDQAAIRKLEQELGVKEGSPTLVLKTSMQDENTRKFISLYRLEYEGPFYPDSQQVDEVRFASVDEINTMIAGGQEKFTPTFLHIFSEYKSATI